LAWDRRDALTGFQVKDFHRVLVVAKGGDKEPLAFYVHAKVIQPTLHVRHRYGLDQFK
jgi:hypothetical protein